jgi:D-alanyl-D-alanine carboxypeptidase
LNKKTLITISLSVIAITIVSGVVFAKITQADDDTSNPHSSQVSTVSSDSNTPGDSDNNGDFTYIPPTLEDDSNTGDDATDVSDFEEEVAAFVPNSTMDLDPASITVFVNKEYALPKNYKPEDLVTPNVIFNLITYDERTLMRAEAASALEELFAAAKEDGLELYGISAYRSYQRQYSIFTSNITKKGKIHTLKYSAVPGTSEHQTGLSIDVSSKSLGFNLSSPFSNSPEGIWLAENAHLYGYIIRYPEDKVDITGYEYEPWHIRYVGIGLANYLYTNNLTLEEYYNYTPSPDFNFEQTYASIINYKPPVVTEIPAKEDDVILGENGEVIDGEIEEGEPPVNGSDDGIDGEDPEVPVTEAPEDDTDLPSDDGDTIEEPLPGDDQDEQGQTPDEEDNTNDNDTEGEITPSVTQTPTDNTEVDVNSDSPINSTDPVIKNSSANNVTSNENYQ